ncbi:unnamed protein product [Urochloa humidicola]
MGLICQQMLAHLAFEATPVGPWIGYSCFLSPDYYIRRLPTPASLRLVCAPASRWPGARIPHLPRPLCGGGSWAAALVAGTLAAAAAVAGGPEDEQADRPAPCGGMPQIAAGCLSGGRAGAGQRWLPEPTGPR